VHRLARNAAVVLAVATLWGCSESPPEVPPRQTSPSNFQYPEELWNAGVEGETIVELYVSEVGTVDSARVNRTSGHEAFDAAAVQGAHRLRFEPARRGSDSVAVRVRLPVQFQREVNDTAGGMEQPSETDTT